MVVIRGFVESSLIDYPGKVASVIFLGGCNYRCGFCHNPSIVNNWEDERKKEDVISAIKKRAFFLDGIVVSGGEPTINDDLMEFLEELKRETKLLIKLDTNGSNPEFLREAIDKGAVDFVAMDIKGALDEYKKITGNNENGVMESLELLRGGKIPYELRMTVVPRFHSAKSFEKIGEMIRGTGKFVLQNFANENEMIDSSLNDEKPYSRENMEEFAEILKGSAKEVVIR